MGLSFRLPNRKVSSFGKGPLKCKLINGSFNISHANPRSYGMAIGMQWSGMHPATVVPLSMSRIPFQIALSYLGESLVARGCFCTARLIQFDCGWNIAASCGESSELQFWEDTDCVRDILIHSSGDVQSQKPFGLLCPQLWSYIPGINGLWAMSSYFWALFKLKNVIFAGLAVHL